MRYGDLDNTNANLGHVATFVRASELVWSDSQQDSHQWVSMGALIPSLWGPLFEIFSPDQKTLIRVQQNQVLSDIEKLQKAIDAQNLLYQKVPGLIAFYLESLNQDRTYVVPWLKEMIGVFKQGFNTFDDCARAYQNSWKKLQEMMANYEEPYAPQRDPNIQRNQEAILALAPQMVALMNIYAVSPELRTNNDTFLWKEILCALRSKDPTLQEAYDIQFALLPLDANQKKEPQLRQLLPTKTPMEKWLWQQFLHQYRTQSPAVSQEFDNHFAIVPVKRS